MRSKILGVVLCLSLLLGYSAAQAASFRGLGFLDPGGVRLSEVTGISADGSVVVGDSASALGGREAFRWTQKHGMVGLGYLPGYTLHSYAYDVSADGSVIVGWGTNTFGQVQASRWTQRDGWVGLGGLDPNSINSIALGVSADGSVVVGYSYNPTTQEAFRWTQSGGMVGLGCGGCSARGVSADGSVIVGISGEAFRWTQGGGMVGLGDLPGGYYGSAAYGVSADGSVVVGNSYSASGMEAFRWTPSTGMVGLGYLPGGGGNFLIRAWDVSADGSVIVGGSSSSSGDRAFTWDATNGMRALSDVLTAMGVDLTGWTLTWAYGISDDGTVIVGDGINPDGNTEAWIADLHQSSEAGYFPLEQPYEMGAGFCDPDYQNYFPKYQHCGIDIFKAARSKVFSVCHGWVRYNATKEIKYKNKEFENWERSFLIIEHDCDGKKIFGYYGHIRSDLQPGAEVQPGENIGYIREAYDDNQERDESNDHLHFGLKVDYVTNGWGREPGKKYEKCKCENKGWQDPFIYFDW